MLEISVLIHLLITYILVFLAHKDEGDGENKDI